MSERPEVYTWRCGEIEVVTPANLGTIQWELLAEYVRIMRPRTGGNTKPLDEALAKVRADLPDSTF